MKIRVINGPNLNLLGLREPEIYGGRTYQDLVDLIERYCAAQGIQVECYQSNCEGELIRLIQGAYGCVDGIVINPAAYTHTSIALLDALKAVAIPAVEVHISDLSKREDFRQISYVAMACCKSIGGKGLDGYLEAIAFLRANCGSC